MNRREDVFNYVEKTDNHWLWTGTTNTGRPIYNSGGMAYMSRQLIYELVKGEPSLCRALRPHCGERMCVHPDHMGGAKLSEPEVAEIIELSKTMSQSKLAKKYGVTQPAIWHVLDRAKNG